MKSLLKSHLFVWSLFAFMGMQAQTSTVLSGNWNTAANWSAGVPGNESAVVENDMTLNVNLNLDNGADYVFNNTVTDVNGGPAYSISQNRNAAVDINANVAIEGSYTMSSNTPTLTIRMNDTLRIGGDFTATQSASVIIEPNGVLIIEGNMLLRNSVSFVVDGNVFVNGNLTLRNSSGVAGAGNLEATGEVDIRQSSSIFGSTTGCPGGCEYGSGVGLPIELISFHAVSTVSKGLKIEWSTASEVINDYFLIEVSADGKKFIELGRQNGAGNSLDRLDYSMVEANPFAEHNGVYVRLSQFDFDGNSETFDEIYVDLSAAPQTIEHNFNVYPNPGNGQQINLNLENVAQGNYQLQLITLSGQVLQSESVQVGRFSSDIQLNNYGGLEKGIYLLRLSNGSEELIEKYVVN